VCLVQTGKPGQGPGFRSQLYCKWAVKRVFAENYLFPPGMKRLSNKPVEGDGLDWKLGLV
jgi:hypothetical protein